MVSFQSAPTYYIFVGQFPSGQEIISTLSFKPKMLQRKAIIDRVTDKIQAFIDTFIEGMGAVFSYIYFSVRNRHDTFEHL